MNFSAFNKLFVCIIAVALSASIWLVSRSWAPLTFHPGWIALACVGVYLSKAYNQALYLTQTHIIFIFLTLAALILARGKHAVWAGFLLAAAAAVKITPIFLLLYWLITGKRRAAAACLAFSALFALAGVLTTGWALNVAYVQSLRAISNMLLVSQNNQSLAALWMGWHYPFSETQVWHALPLPPLVKWTSTLLTIASVVIGGLLDRSASPSRIELSPPYGAAFAMLGATMFASISWNHYYLLLIFPLMLMLNAILEHKSVIMSALTLAVFTLNLHDSSIDNAIEHHQLFTALRPQFFSGLLCMAALVLLSMQSRGRSDSALVESQGRKVDLGRLDPVA